MSASSSSICAAHLRRDALRPALARARLRELAQVRGGGFPGGHELARIFVAQLVEREVRERGDLHASPPAARVDRAARAVRARADGVRRSGCRRVAGLRERDAVAHRRERILQTAPFTHVHVHVAGGGQRQRRARRPAPRQCCETLAIAAVAHELHRDPGAAGERARDPFALRRIRLRAAAGGSHSASVPRRRSPTNSSTSARASA